MSSKTERETIAAFDFDGTITTKDSLAEFLKFTHSYAQLAWGAFLLAPILALYAAKIIPNYKAKEKLFSRFYRNWTLEQFNEKCRAFSAQIDTIVNPNASAALKDYEAKGIKIVVITASIENWVAPWANANGIKEVLGTKIEVDSNNRITGKFLSKNCYGQEKVNRLLAQYPNREKYILDAYGDSRGDKELLAFADAGYLKKF